jgi:uncharacterized membrane protein
VELPIPLLIVCGVLALASVPLILGKVPPNDYYGVRTSATRASPSAWYAANRTGGVILFLAAIASATLLSTGALAPLLALLAPIAVALCAIALYLRLAPLP